MRRSHQRFFGTVSSQRLDCQDERPAEPQMIIKTFTTGEQLVLLETSRRSELAKTVLASMLRRSTARPTGPDYTSLAQQRFIQHNGVRYELTPMGMFHANQVARELAKQFEIPMLTTNTATTRKAYEPGVKARFHYW